MGTADPGRQFLRHVRFVSGEISVKYEGKNLLEIHAKPKKQQCVLSNKQKHAVIATFMTKTFFSSCVIILFMNKCFNIMFWLC